jgi:hypothetical protein
VAKTPPGFGRVTRVNCAADHVVLQNAIGTAISVPIQTQFLDGKALR